MDAILIFLLGGLVGALAPAPFDFIHFWLQNHLYHKHTSRGWFEFLQFVDWYLVDGAYWGVLVGAYFLFGLNAMNINAWRTILTILGIGAVIGVVSIFLFRKQRRK